MENDLIISRENSRLVVYAVVIIAIIIAIRLLFKNWFKGSGVVKSELPTGGQGLYYTDSSGKQRRYDPVPLADRLNVVLNEDPGWYEAYDIDVTDLETLLRELNSLPNEDMKYAVIDSYNNRYSAEFGSLTERLNDASYWVTDPTYRDITLRLIYARNQYSL